MKKLLLALVLFVMPLAAQLDFQGATNANIVHDNGWQADTDSFTACMWHWSLESWATDSVNDFLFDISWTTSANQDGFRFLQNAADDFRFRLHAGGVGTNLDFTGANAKIDQDAWNLFCVSYDGTNMYMRINDEATQSGAKTGNVDDATSALCVMGSHLNSTACDSDYADESHLGGYFLTDNTAINDAEFAQLYTLITNGAAQRLWEYVPRLLPDLVIAVSFEEDDIGSAALTNIPNRAANGDAANTSDPAGTSLNYEGPRLAQ